MHIENDRTTTALTIFKTRSLVADTSLVVLARAPAAPARARTSLQKTHLFLSFPYDCPEPVSVKWSFLHLKWRVSKKKGVFAHHRGSANSYHIRLPTTPAGKKRHNETTRARTVESVRVQFVFREPVFASKGNTMQICFPFVCPIKNLIFFRKNLKSKKKRRVFRSARKHPSPRPTPAPALATAPARAPARARGHTCP